MPQGIVVALLIDRDEASRTSLLERFSVKQVCSFWFFEQSFTENTAPREASTGKHTVETALKGLAFHRGRTSDSNPSSLPG